MAHPACVLSTHASNAGARCILSLHAVNKELEDGDFIMGATWLRWLPQLEQRVQ